MITTFIFDGVTLQTSHFASLEHRFITRINTYILTPSYGKPSQKTETCDSSKYHKDWKAARLPFVSKMMQVGPEELPATSRTNRTHDLHLLSYTRIVAETANLRLTSTATQDVVPRQTLIALFLSRNWLTDADTYIHTLFHPKGLFAILMHQSIPALPIPPPLPAIGAFAYVRDLKHREFSGRRRRPEVQFYFHLRSYIWRDVV